MAAAKILAGAAKTVAPRFRDMFIQAVPEALTGGLLTGGSHLLLGGKPDEALALGLADTVASAGTLGLLNKAKINNPLVRNIANLGTGMVTSKAVYDTLYSDRYPQQGQGSQAATTAQQQAQRADVNGQLLNELAGKYLNDTMFQAMQGQESGDLVRMMNSLGPTYDVNTARSNMAAIMGV